MDDEIRHAIAIGLKTICFTEHNDYGGRPDGSFVVDTPPYHDRLMELRDKYRDRIEILFGVEAGLQPVDHIREYFREYIPHWGFDFVIGSSHVARGKDPYYPEFFDDYPDDDEGYRAYFTEEYENAMSYDNYDSYGHIDYIMRYGKSKNRDFTYEKFAPELDRLLSAIISHGKCIEINSAGYRQDLGEPNPNREIVKRYHEMGGLPPTIGSDAHEVKYMAADFDRVEEVLRYAGYSSYSIFRKRERSEILL